MKLLSEFMEECEALLKQHGDLEIKVEDDTDATIEFYSDSDVSDIFLIG